MMLIVFGFRHFGKVDAVPGICHIATQFGHLNFFPLLPNHSYLILERKSDGIKEVQIPRSRKSVLVAWGRASLWLAMLISTAFLQMAWKLAVDRSSWALWIVFPLSLIPPILLFLSYRLAFIARASIDRVREFADLDSLPQETRIQLKRVIKQMSSVFEE